MGRPVAKTITEAEERVLQALWSVGEGSVGTVQAELNKEGDVAYTTVQTMLGVLCEKGYAARKKKARAFMYRPLVTEATARRQAIAQLAARFFKGSPRALALHLIEENDLDAEALAALREELGQPPKPRRKG